MEKEIYIFEEEITDLKRNSVIQLPLQAVYNLDDYNSGNCPSGKIIVGYGIIDPIDDIVTITEWQEVNSDYMDSQLSAMLFLLM